MRVPTGGTAAAARRTAHLPVPFARAASDERSNRCTARPSGSRISPRTCHPAPVISPRTAVRSKCWICPAASDAARAAGRRAEMFRSSGTSITTARATRIISRNSASGKRDMLEHVARVREVVRAVCGGHVLAVEHRRLGDLGSPGGHLDRGGRDLEPDAPVAEAAAPQLRQHPAVTAPDVRDGAGRAHPDRRRELDDVVGLCDRRQRAPAAVELGVRARRVGIAVEGRDVRGAQRHRRGLRQRPRRAPTRACAASRRRGRPAR